MLTGSSQKVAAKYICEECDYSTCKASNWMKHISTQKHRMLINANVSTPDAPNTAPGEYACDACGRTYRHKTSLSRHRRNCSVLANHATSSKPPTQETEDIAELRAKAALYDQQCESVNELKALVEKVAERPTTVTNTTNNLNINVFLERQCSQALNITDFVNSLRLTLEDLSYTQRNGFVKGVSNVFIRNLQELRPAARPIHCVDKQGKRLYIKDANKWGEDADGRLLETQIGLVTRKQIEALKAWESANQHWRDTEDGTRAYMALVQKITGTSSDAERRRSEQLIREEIGKNCGIDDLSPAEIPSVSIPVAMPSITNNKEKK